MGEKHRDKARNRQGKLTTVACWLVLAAVLLGILRFTSLGARTTPTLDLSASHEAAIRLWRPPGSPAHRLVAVGLGAADELFLLDTGAAETVISPAAAARAGLIESARPVSCSTAVRSNECIAGNDSMSEVFASSRRAR